ncbi:hypothetical protein [Halobacterium noricense]|uniref:hypothetical protein n=1 Tax=Halobacterium noricense TaxID=223182 RepID=UPI001E2AB7A9|nr:hypothetical protein [Halobacterium noricense]UHH26505.1 hypothetical protein LT974_06095 [Halobacterium noricense]
MSSNASDALGGSTAGAAEQVGRDLLEQYTESWSVADDLPAKASIRDVQKWDAMKEIERTLTVTESQRQSSVPPSEAPSRGDAVPIDERYDHAPDGFEEKTVAFADFEGASLVRCTGCGGSGKEGCSTCDQRAVVQCDDCGGDGTTDCGECSGNGTQTCRDCNGTGESGDATCRRCSGAGETVCQACSGAGNQRCARCNGAGEVTCPDCAGTGEVPCSRCSGAGELYETTRGTLEFEPSSSFSVDDLRGADSEWFAEVDGDRLDKTVRQTPSRAGDDGSATVEHEVEQRAVPVTKVTYEYGGDDYALYEVGRNLHSHGYPKSTTRRLIPVVVSLLLAAGAGYYYFVL